MHRTTARGLVAIQTRPGTFTVVEMTGNDPINLGGRIEWRDDRPGGTAYFNQTKAVRFAVNVYAHGFPESRVRQRLRL